MAENKKIEDLTPRSIIFHYDTVEKPFDYYIGDKYSNRGDFVKKAMEDNISMKEAIIIWQSFDMAFDKLMNSR